MEYVQDVVTNVVKILYILKKTNIRQTYILKGILPAVRFLGKRDLTEMKNDN